MSPGLSVTNSLESGIHWRSLARLTQCVKKKKVWMKFPRLAKGQAIRAS
jgi:hypothetical protein